MQLMLPHLLRNSSYAEYYHMLCQDPTQYVIMDNGAAESAQQYDDDALITIGATYGVHEIVATDHMGEADFSAAKTIQFIRVADAMDYSGKIGVVAQGGNKAAAIECMREISRYVDFDVIYIPRLLVKVDDKFARLELAALFNHHFPNNDIHLLGASNLWCTEFVEAAQIPYIRSMDTSMPFVYGMHRQVMTDADKLIPHRGADSDYFFRIWSVAEEDVCMRNVRFMQEAVCQ